MFMLSELHWFAFRVLYNRSANVIRRLQEDGVRYFVPMRTVEKITDKGLEYIEEPVFTSLLFVQCTLGYINTLRRTPDISILMYSRPGTTEPAIVADRERIYSVCGELKPGIRSPYIYSIKR